MKLFNLPAPTGEISQGSARMSSNKAPLAAKKKTTPPPIRETVTPDSAAYRALLDSLSEAIAPLQALHQQAVESLATGVREIIGSRSRDARLIEQTLDHLLNHACIPQGLALFKSLCRHYWEINPHATASYISIYREMWDFSDQETKEAEFSGDLLDGPEVTP